jgi:penicillin amidase
MKIFNTWISVILTVAFVWVLQTKIGDIPPLGKLLNPATGFWQNAESRNFKTEQSLNLKGLQAEVIIKFDEHRIPHIFAQNDHDLYYAQGYLTARDRLWQMDIQTRSASGRLAEVVGPKALETDRYHRRMGMVYGAENSIRQMMKEPRQKAMITAYTEGINSYIRSLSPGEYPIEFKLLNYAPEEWKPINCAFLLKLMSETLAGGSEDFAMTNTLEHFGGAITNDLFPDQALREEPIIPPGTKWNFKPAAIPQVSQSFKARVFARVKPREKVEGIGSNNWAIAGNRTASGYPILANDPHLNLTYPSIWYQIQLASPTVNVNGVSLPGAPGVVIGYNQKVSWGVTNVDADVLDWYQIKFKDQTKTEYWYNNKWNKITKRVEIIKVRGQATVYDTVTYTHHGPIVYENAKKKPVKLVSAQIAPVGAALRWIAHDASEDLLTFYLLNRAKNYADYREALSHYTAPAQNFIFASADNDIAITPNGKFPLKFKDQGKFILDGSDPANDWHGWIPFEQNPTSKNPARGYLSSANQTLTDASYPYYINWQFGPYERGKRINDRLAAMTKATVNDMQILQTDTYSIFAQDALPLLLKYVDASKLNDEQLNALKAVEAWDKNFSATSIGATIFDNWWTRFYNMTWNDDMVSDSTNFNLPNRDRTLKLLLKQPNSRWFDNQRTPAVESGAEIVDRAFNIAVDDMAHDYGKLGPKWQWGRVNPKEVGHMAGLDGFGSGTYTAGGTNTTVNALSGGHGPSWRMVVQLGPRVKGYGVLPGGESGNAGSYYYDDMLPIWKAGKLNELLFLGSAKEKSRRIRSVLTLKKK